jgi:hypothetical protein
MVIADLIRDPEEVLLKRDSGSKAGMTNPLIKDF